ncbi:MAG TPA: FAD-dependent oxidoreductase [Negativicutes bacterium]|jgi:fumarate reductase flavoprotein subunit
MKEEIMGISRRNFIKGAAAGAVSIATIGVLGGCSSNEKAKTSTATNNKPAASAFEIAPAPIPDSQIKGTVEADIVIVGGGIAGLTAALSGAAEGAKVVVLEKHTVSRYGGGDSAAIGSRVHKKLGINLNIEDMIRGYIKHTEFYVNHQLISSWAYNSAKIMDLFLDLVEPAGVPVEVRMWPEPAGWNPEKEYNEVYPTAHSIGPNGGDTNKYLIEAITKASKEKGVDFRYSTPAEQLGKDSSGRVTSVIAKDKDGNYIKFNAGKGVILACGDFGNNPEMMQKYYSPDMCKLAKEANIYTASLPKDQQPKGPLNTGDGHKMAIWSGAAMEEGPYTAMTVAMTPFGGPFLHVNGNGERFHNEDAQAAFWLSEIFRQPGKVGWQLFDSKWEQEYPNLGEWDMWGWAPISDTMREQVKDTALTANTIDELAQQMQVPADKLKATVARRNELAALGQDLDFGLKPNRITTIQQPPFFAAKIGGYFTVTLSGVRVNSKMQVLDKNVNPIPGLYAAGNVVGERFGRVYSPFLTGLSNGLAESTGYLAAKEAVGVKV